MTEKELKQAIREVVKNNYLGQTVGYESRGGIMTFKAEGYKISTRKRLIPKDEWEDYGVDEETQTFIILEFWDAKEEDEATDSVCCIFTLNDKGQVGTSDAPYDFEYDLNYDLALELADQITEWYRKEETNQ